MQLTHFPHACSLMPVMTRSPGLKSRTASPLATTTPVPSWDMVMGNVDPNTPARTIRSVWQSEATAVRKIKSCGPSLEMVGVGTFWIASGALYYLYMCISGWSL